MMIYTSELLVKTFHCENSKRDREREKLRTGEVPIEKMLHFEPRKRKFMQL
jgi:hypothetical protein